MVQPRIDATRRRLDLATGPATIPRQRVAVIARLFSVLDKPVAARGEGAIDQATIEL